MYVWPHCVFPARSVRWSLRGVAMTGGVPVSGTPNLSRTDGGGFWVCEMDGIWLHTPDQIRTARAWDAIMDGGATPVIVQTYEPQFAPVPVGYTLPPPVPHDDGAPFDDDTLYAGGLIEAIVGANAALRATTLRINMLVGSGLRGGEVFSIDHPTKGKRRYTVARVTGVVTTANFVEIRPPLREAVTTGTLVEFDYPGTVMRLANADEFLGALESGRFANLKAVFVEHF